MDFDRRTHMSELFGYFGKLLRVNVAGKTSSTENIDESVLKQFIGGAALGIKYIYDEVKPGTTWSAPENKIFLGTGPVGGTRIAGSGGVCVVTVGAQTGGMTSTQANGYFGAFLRFCGFDAMIVEGQSPDWVYIYVHDGKVEIKDATHLLDKGTLETEAQIKKELDKRERQMSVLTIGPAGENLVKFACAIVDGGHAAAHNGVGAVMGSKKIKAIAIERGTSVIPVKDKDGINNCREELLKRVMSNPMQAGTYKEGTVGGVVMSTKGGVLPVKNYTTGIYTIDPDKLQKYNCKDIREAFNAKPSPCWACGSTHCHVFTAPQGTKFAGKIMEEPEYEGMAAFSSQIGVKDMVTTVILANMADHYGMDVNESGWLYGFLMECYEKKVLTAKDFDGLEMNWGNSDAVLELMDKIAHRRGAGDVFAEGVMRVARKIGGEAVKFAIHSEKGNSPRGHDHRVLRFEQFDTSVSNLGTLEAHSMPPFKQLGIQFPYDMFDPDVLPVINAKVKGAMIFEDSIITCRFQTDNQLDLMVAAVNAATGWDLDIPKALESGKRAVNLARLFNLASGIDAKLDKPSMRYGSMPLDGPAAGKAVLPNWDRMIKNYYNAMGWDANGKPLPETLEKLDLKYAISK
jgi:aldehyde:ferredoxin oxidoreductase